MDDLLAEFIAETREMLETIAGEIVAWEANPGDSVRLDEIFRFVHTVKGSAGFLDLQQLLKLSHEAEDVLSDLRAGRRESSPSLVSAILAIIDRIGTITDALERGEDIDDREDEQLLAALSAEDSSTAAAAVPARVTPQRNPQRSIRVPVELLDQLMSGVSELVLARNELSRQHRRISGDHDLDTAFERISACIAGLRDTITWTRMQRIDGLFAALPRIVRDLSTQLGKEVSLDIDGSDVELDREMIEMLRDPLTHIVRNALDHGLELPAERKLADKPSKGLLQISASQSGNQIQITISDDGRGIDTDELRRRAIAAHIIDAQRAAELSHESLCELIFRPGLTTTEAVSAVSGRGVGMDVVRTNVERIGGSIEIESSAGNGTVIKLCVPLTLTIVPALIVGVGDEQFALPRVMIDEIVSLAKATARIETVGNTEVVVARGRRVPLVRLSQIFAPGDPAGEDKIMIVLRPSRGERFALAVSVVFDHEELVVKPAAPGVMSAGIYAGTALPDNGRPLLVLDTAGIAARAGLRLDMARRYADAMPKAGEAEPIKSVETLVFDDCDGRRRAIRMGVVERILSADVEHITMSAGRLRVTLGEEIVPVIVNGVLPESGSVRLLRLNDGETQLAYAIGGAADVMTLPPDFEAAAQPGRIAGVAVIGGAPVELLDVHYIFAEFASDHPASGERPLCLVIGGDEHWRRQILGPLVESAGYRVAYGGDPEAGSEQADVVIAADETADGGAGECAAVVRLTATPDTGGGRVYRYDRAGIYHALRARRRAGE